jgi:hypothetical protein
VGRRWRLLPSGIDNDEVIGAANTMFDSHLYTETFLLERELALERGRRRRETLGVFPLPRQRRSISRIYQREAK